MATVLLKLLPGSLPAGYCYPSNPQTLNVDMFNIASAVFPDTFGVVNFGDTKPSPENSKFPWIRTVAGAPVWPTVWVFYNGVWVARHPDDPGSIVRRWVTDISGLPTYDGGDANPADGFASGAMWLEDTDFQGRSPMHPGAIAGAVPAKTLAASESYGEGSHQLVLTELPSYKFKISGFLNNVPVTSAGETRFTFGGPPGATGISPGVGTVDSTGSDAPHNTVHPVRGLYCIKRSTRIFYKVP